MLPQGFTGYSFSGLLCVPCGLCERKCLSVFVLQSAIAEAHPTQKAKRALCFLRATPLLPGHKLAFAQEREWQK
jgi:hypothetical protein